MTVKKKPFNKAQFRAALRPIANMLTAADAASDLNLYLDPYIASYIKLKFGCTTWNWPPEETVIEVIEDLLGGYYEGIDVSWGYSEYVSCHIIAKLKRKFRPRSLGGLKHD